MKNINVLIPIFVIVLLIIVLYIIIPKVKENYHSILFGVNYTPQCGTGKCNAMGRCPKSNIPCGVRSRKGCDGPFQKGLYSQFDCPRGYKFKKVQCEGNEELGYCVPKADPFYN